MTRNDGTGSDTANWGGALVTMAAGVQDKPSIIAAAAETAPAIASSRLERPDAELPALITGATPGRPFMFQIPRVGRRAFDVLRPRICRPVWRSMPRRPHCWIPETGWTYSRADYRQQREGPRDRHDHESSAAITCWR
jgi:hypothetical protein